MPRPQQALGRPGTPVIPTHWQESHGAVAAKTRTQPVNLRKPGSMTTFNTTAEHTDVTPLAPYATDVLARIQAHRETSQDSESEQVEETLRVTGYLITLPFDCAPEVGDLIDIPTSCSDAALAGITLRIVELIRGSLRFERDVFAVINDSAEDVTPS
jgi:hypothetical protein